MFVERPKKWSKLKKMYTAEKKCQKNKFPYKDFIYRQIDRYIDRDRYIYIYILYVDRQKEKQIDK